jgi:hypothetical protein
MAKVFKDKINLLGGGYTLGNGNQSSQSDSGVAVTMPFDSLAFKGNFSPAFSRVDVSNL